MKTTLVIDDGIFVRLKQEAARSGETMSALVEGALRLWLDRPAQPVSLRPLPVYDLGVPLVDVLDRDAVERATGREP